MTSGKHNILCLIISLFLMSQTLTHFDLFWELPTELRHKIWEHSAEYPRFIELVVQNNFTERDVLKDNGFAYFRNAINFDRQLPRSLLACKEAWNAIVPLYSKLNLGEDRGQRQADIEYVWMEQYDPDPKNMLRTAVWFNPDYDTVVLQAGHVLHKQGVLQNMLPEKLERMPTTRNNQKSRVQHLVTTFFPWDKSPGLPNSPGDMVDAFPEISTLCVIGQRNEKCDCGYCLPSSPNTGALETVRQQVIETLEPIMEKKRREVEELQDEEYFADDDEPVRKCIAKDKRIAFQIPKVRACPMNYRREYSEYGNRKRPWYGFIAPRKVFKDNQGLSLSSDSDRRSD